MTPRTVLVTAFEPFGGESVNSSLRVLEQFRPPPGARLKRLVLPVVFSRSLEVLEQALAELRPDVVLALGQAGGRAKVSLERVAINLNDARIPDNEGQQPVDAPVVMGGPAAYFSTLPLKRMLKALLGAGIPAQVSYSAGTFVCNHLMYGLLHCLAARHPEARGGFVHLPYLPEQVAGQTAPGLDLEVMVRALELCLVSALDGAPDLRLAAGQTH